MILLLVMFMFSWHVTQGFTGPMQQQEITPQTTSAHKEKKQETSGESIQRDIPPPWTAGCATAAVGGKMGI